MMAAARAMARMGQGWEAQGGEDAGHDQGGEGPDHIDFAVREVDQLDDAVDHRVAHGDEGVDAAPGQPAEEKFEEIVHGRPVDQGAWRP
jgi:hypothetical protein